MTRTAEHLLQDQIALIAAALADCLAQAAPSPQDGEGFRRDAELLNAAKLLKASARLGEALARLRGQTSHTVRVTRGEG